jgi:diacylglycerol kinase (ATP)
MKSSKPYSLKARFNSFIYAYAGIKYFLRYEPQALIHLIAAILVIFAGFYFKITRQEWFAVIFSIGIVIVSEMLNTAIEKLTDMVSPEVNPKAKVVKDLAAGAVLFASIIAAVIGLIVFLPKMFF